MSDFKIFMLGKIEQLLTNSEYFVNLRFFLLKIKTTSSY